MKARGLGFHAVIVGLHPAGAWEIAGSMEGNLSLKAFKYWNELVLEQLILGDAKGREEMKHL
jgi:hypothetical protein